MRDLRNIFAFKETPLTTSTLSQNGQTTIPAKVRQFLHLETHRKIPYRFEGGKVVLEPVRSSTDSLYGSLKTAKKAPTPAQLRKARTDYAAKKYGRPVVTEDRDFQKFPDIVSRRPAAVLQRFAP